MLSYRYSRWDGSQDFQEVHQDELMDELSDYLLAHGDLSSALRMMMQRGMKGQPLLGLQDLLQRLRSRRQERLDRYNLGSIVEEVRKRLDQILHTEREGIKRKVEETRAKAQKDHEELSPEAAQSLLKFLEKLAKEKEEFLSSLPKETGKALKALSEYEFMDPEAKRQYDELMDLLRQQVAESLFRQLQQGLSGMSKEDAARLAEMVKALNQMIREKFSGGEPDFQGFMEKFGDYFGPNPPNSLDELLSQLREQIKQMRSLMESMGPQQRQALEEMVESILSQGDLRDEVAELAAYLRELFPGDRPQRYPFKGEEPLTFQEALRLMEELGKMDELERQLRAAQYGEDASSVDSQAVRDLLGEEEARSLETLRNLAKKLEEAGYIQRVGQKLELTAKGMRRIGQRALRDIFDRIKKDRFGKHETARAGVGVERSDDSKPYEFGDPFHLDLEQTVMNALEREGPGTPVKILPADFEVYKTEYLSQCSTVLMLDLSWSMARRGSFYAAKKVVMALHNLIKTQFPKDNLYIVGFSTYAREMKAEQLPHITWDQSEPYTNMQQGFMISQKLLSKHKGGTKQIIMISDGEPTAHIERGQIFLGYPPSSRTIQETLKEVQHCTRQGIIINTFMLDRSYYLKEFVDQLTKINKGRAFYTSPDKLGQYILVDYLAGKKKRIA